MPSQERRVLSFVAEYRTWLIAHNYTESTIRDYTLAIKRTLTTLMDAGMTYNPRKIGKEEVNFLLDVAWKDRATGTNKVEMAIFGKWLERMGSNPVVSNMEIMWPSFVQKGTRPLPPNQCFSMMDQLDGAERIVTHLMLYLGYRMIEVRRAQVSDIDWVNRRMLVHGKGHKGGKSRWVYFHHTTESELMSWLQQREELISAYRQDCLKKGLQPQDVPSNLLIYYSKAHGIGAYKHTAMENLVKRIFARTGLEGSAHSLRKSFARNLYLSGVKIEVISSLLGHTDPRTTIKYLGIEQDDQADAQDMLSQFEKKYKVEK